MREKITPEEFMHEYMQSNEQEGVRYQVDTYGSRTSHATFEEAMERACELFSHGTESSATISSYVNGFPVLSETFTIDEYTSAMENGDVTSMRDFPVYSKLEADDKIAHIQYEMYSAHRIEWLTENVANHSVNLDTVVQEWDNYCIEAEADVSLYEFIEDCGFQGSSFDAFEEFLISSYCNDEAWRNNHLPDGISAEWLALHDPNLTSPAFEKMHEPSDGFDTFTEQANEMNVDSVVVEIESSSDEFISRLSEEGFHLPETFTPNTRHTIQTEDLERFETIAADCGAGYNVTLKESFSKPEPKAHKFDYTQLAL